MHCTQQGVVVFQQHWVFGMGLLWGPCLALVSLQGQNKPSGAHSLGVVPSKDVCSAFIWD